MKTTFGLLLNSLGAWRRLVALRMKPKAAYEVAKYAKMIGEECDLVTQQRDALIRDLTGTKPGEPARIEEGTEMYAEFQRQNAEIMVTECDVALAPMRLAEVLDSLIESDATALTPQDLLALDMFFLPEGEIENDEEFLRNEDGAPKEVID